MKKQLLFAGAFCLGLGAFGLLSSFDDGEQAKIDAKYEELKTKFMEEQMQKCQETADEEAMRLYKEENGEATAEEPTKSGATTAGSTRPTPSSGGSATSGSEGSSATPAEEATSGGATKDPQKGRGGATTKGDADAQKKRGGATTTNDASSQKRRPGAN